MRVALAIIVVTTALAGANVVACAQAPHGSCDDSVGWLAGEVLPDGTVAEARLLETWLARTPDLDAELLDSVEIEALNRRNSSVIGAWRDPLVDRAPTIEEVDGELERRLSHMELKLASGQYVLGPEPTGDHLPAPGEIERTRRRVEGSMPVDVVQAIVEPIDLRCIPLDGGIYRGRIDRAFDRNQCSRLHPGALARVLRVAADGWVYVRVGHGVGWLRHPELSPPMTAREARELVTGPQLTVLDDLVPATTVHGEVIFLRLGAELPLIADDRDDSAGFQVLVPTARGWSDAFVTRSEAVVRGRLPLTRRNVLELAFARLDDPYGWGGIGGFRDCSRLLLDVVSTFGLRLGRNSSVQGVAGHVTVDVSGMSDDDKRAAIRAAADRGIVFLYMRGHIMLYLGELDGRDYALSAISEYLMPCPGGGHRTVRIDRVDVTDLERGRGTERTSFIERITTLAIFGR